jgi:predicted house-cleaning noncanonical NTP pyrophosphatase (MazG superfamily)
VRDRIPEIIQAAGKKCATAVLEDSEYLAQLERKLTEEWDEYLT